MSDSYLPADARADFASWRYGVASLRSGPDHHLRAVTAHHVDGPRLDALVARAAEFAATLVGDVGPLVLSYELVPPRLERFDGDGNRIESVVFSPDHHAAGAILWDSGLVSDAAEAGRSFEQATVAYLASMEGEMGHMCAATCTTGLIRVLRRYASPSTRERFLPALSQRDYRDAAKGAQFLTEVQGGSDVGVNAAVAQAAPDGTYRITGEKWFCSVVNADTFLVMARPEGGAPGTSGLGCFVVPRLVDDRPNGFTIRRLKDKLGTTSMASGEIDFVDAVAYPVGPPDQGFRIMVTAMLNTSRWLNAVGDVGIMRRAYVEASSYARHRRAFGSRIGDYPLVRRQLAGMKAEWLAALHSTWALTALDEAIDVAIAAGAEPEVGDAALHRFLVNANKLTCAAAATDVVRSAVEVLGGNGAIESFSVLPRLLRDCVVYEQWEGTHNVLAAQVLRDMGRLGLAGTVIDHIARMLKGVADPELGDVAARAARGLEAVGEYVARSVEDSGHGALHFRDHLEHLVRALQVAHLLEVAERADGGVRTELAAAARWMTGLALEPAYTPADDPAHLATIDALLGGDLDP